jgi:ABC-type Fe3+/spermidine/putrescine transport system ATPase subunit
MNCKSTALILPSQDRPFALSPDMVDIALHDLTKRFGTQTVLDRVSLKIAAGEFFFLLGPSGCGKTTLLRHLAGFLQPDSGRIAFGGEDVTRLPPHQRETGMMFQSYALWPHLSVAENVAFGLEERRLPRAEVRSRVAEALDRVQLGNLGARRIGQLSGGQQQRVALARALVIRPRCLLLDEPLSNLDAKLRHEMRAEIRRIVKEFGLTAVHVTHDRDEALSMADRLAVMDAGRIAQVGTPETVYRDPSCRMVADFIGSTNLVPATAGAVVTESQQEVWTTFGRLLGRASGTAPAPGTRVLLSIRPEALFFDPPSDAINRLSAHITDLTYLGATAQYEVQVTGGPKLQICEINPRVLRRPGETEVRLAVSPEDVVLLPAEG